VVEVAEELTQFFSTMMPLLDKLQRRVLAAPVPRCSAVVDCPAMSRNAVITGTKEVISDANPTGGRWPQND
jgi:hypothetical protein